MRQGFSECLLTQRAVKLRSHAVQALEFIAAGVASARDHARDRQGVMRRELRKDAPARVEKLLRADKIVEIAHRLAAEDRIIGKPALLRPLDLRVPISAFDEADREAPIVVPRQFEDKVEHGFGALLIGLDGETEPRPVRASSGSWQTASNTSSENSSRSASSASMVTAISAARARPRDEQLAARARSSRAGARSLRTADAAPRA